MNDDEFLGGVRVLYDLKGEASMSPVVGMLYAAVKKTANDFNLSRMVCRKKN